MFIAYHCLDCFCFHLPIPILFSPIRLFEDNELDIQSHSQSNIPYICIQYCGPCVTLDSIIFMTKDTLLL
jgi:hypothetical protein